MPKIKKRYINPDNPELSITPSAFKKLSKKRQIEFMREWFGERYEDPNVSQPYDGEEGGYCTALKRKERHVPIWTGKTCLP